MPLKSNLRCTPCTKKPKHHDDHDDEDEDEEEERHHKEVRIIVKKIIKETNEGKHHGGFPDVNIIGLSVKESGDAMICAFDFDSSNIECQQFGMENNKVNQGFWRIIELLFQRAS
jgi:hypothetical protein